MAKIIQNPIVLSIAGSDSSAGAGIQADLKTISALGGYGCTAITAVTAQNTQGVRSLNPVPTSVLQAQCEAVFDDLDICSVKIGMLPNADSIRTVAQILQKYRPPFVVLDPVMVATSGDSLVEDNICQALLEHLLPLADIITPNLSELAQLTDCSMAKINDETLIKIQAQKLLSKGAKAVLAKGGHLENNTATDWLIMPDFSKAYQKPRIHSKNTHGTGCTLSSAIATMRPQVADLSEAVAAAKNFVHGAIEAAAHWQLGKGHGPLDHFYSNLSSYHFTA
ncbi:MAG: bifunctional hydroxymethylpyrimidine kinase/phosphomethylpyrimidine kinase [Neisseriaceae bacterium]|nr:bifunctional hydroxymethylpyrimidine kinase/phosphomethylpyrimidine kinase [Neisseriaceae bacterium]